MYMYVYLRFYSCWLYELIGRYPKYYVPSRCVGSTGILINYGDSRISLTVLFLSRGWSRSNELRVVFLTTASSSRARFKLGCTFLHVHVWIPGEAKLAILFEQWVACDGHWSESSLLVTLRQEHRLRRLGARKWMTFHELVIKYGGTSPAQKIVAAKRADEKTAKEQIRPHRDCPHDRDPWLSHDKGGMWYMDYIVLLNFEEFSFLCHAYTFVHIVLVMICNDQLLSLTYS